ncbi:MAG: DUF5664 domain-containing protein [Clostridiales bacterium]|nr:DUF5664 domain-containing protein [Clostridiales bacterium]
MRRGNKSNKIVAEVCKEEGVSDEVSLAHYTCPQCGKKHNYRTMYETCSKRCADALAKSKLAKEANDKMGLKFDTDKLRYSLVPPAATRALAEILTFGTEKYAPNNWQLVCNPEERYTDALLRHLESYRAGEKIDPESGFSHLKHAITNIAFLLHFEDAKE